MRSNCEGCGKLVVVTPREVEQEDGTLCARCRRESFVAERDVKPKEQWRSDDAGE
jgi:hypothetical protein